MGEEGDLDFETRVKRLVVGLGRKHRNLVTELRSMGNGVDTVRRRAWFRFGVNWTRTPSPALTDEMRASVQIPPSVQAYASDVDTIEIELVMLADSLQTTASPRRDAPENRMEPETLCQSAHE
ncbi:hypothetical protein [Paraburkholderia sp. J8-2]|uniref:hypothetical protein n=1 Tax=Paraburkholderia sp. J8-2 TaxID=2805440 RepID=UPI002AB6F7BB|nr:hypothetical protein [Paraburkholderia sp. J8-2]